MIGGMLTDTLIASLFISVSFYVSERFSREPQKGRLPDAAPAPISGGERHGVGRWETAT